MQNEKLKAMAIVGLLIVAIGIPAIYFATTIQGEKDLKPVAIITAPDTGHVLVPVSFSAQKSYDPDGHITLYVWNFGDGTTSAGVFVNHTYKQVGNYTVKLTVYDNAGGASVTEKKVAVKHYEERAKKVSVDDLLSKTDEYMGTSVIVKGVFAEGQNYSFYMVNVSGSRGIRVYVEPGAPRPEKVEYGDLMEVRALFTVYQNTLELKVENNSKDYVSVIGHNAPVSYETITSETWQNHNNSLVRMQERVTDVYASYRYKMGNITVYVQRGANHTGSPAIGDYFAVQGFLTYYKPRNYSGYMELIVRNGTADYSKYINSSYSQVSINCILNTPDRLLDYAVNTTAVVTDEYASWKFWVGGEESSDTVQVYVEKGAPVHGYLFTGAQVRIHGMLILYNHTWELKIRAGTDDSVTVLNTPAYVNATVPELLGNLSLLNKSVHSWGVVSWTYHNATSGLTLFGLYYGGKELTVVGFKGSNITGLVSGYHADVYGLFTEYNGEFEIKINPDSYDHVVCAPQNYTNVNISAILADPDFYNNTLVHISYSKIVSVYQSWKFWVSNSSSNSEDIVVYVEKGGTVNGTPVTGAAAEIWAMVTEYNGTWELKIRNGTADKVDVLNTTNYVTVNITQLIENASAYNNTDVYVPNATVVSTYASWLFWVSNSTSNTNDISVYADSGVSMPTVGPGDIVEIYGTVINHNGSYELHIRAGTQDRVNVLYSQARYVNFSYIHQVNSTGALVHLGEQVIVNGTVISEPDVFSFTTSTGAKILKFYIENTTGGVLVFGYNLDYTALNLTDGDHVQVRGTIEQYAGEAELKISSLEYVTLLGSGSPPAPLNLTTGYFENWTQVETIEGMLVHINGTVVKVNTTYHYILVNDSTGTVEVYFSSSQVSMPNVSVNDTISVVGVVKQYDKSSPYTSGYEILPRYAGDVNITTKSVAQHDSNLREKNKISFEVIVWRRRFAPIAEDMLVH